MRNIILGLTLLLCSMVMADEKTDLNNVCLKNASAELKNKAAVCQCVATNLVATGHFSAPVVALYSQWMNKEISEETANNNPNFLYLNMASEIEYSCAENPKYKLDRTHH